MELMEESVSKGDFRMSSLRPSGTPKPMLSVKTNSRNSSSLRRYHSSRTPRRDGRGSGLSASQWFHSNRVVYWLLLITLWAYLGFYVQSRWAHGDNKNDIFGHRSELSNDISNIPRRGLDSEDSQLVVKNATSADGDKRVEVVMDKKGNDLPSQKEASSKKRNKKSGRSFRGKTRGKQKSSKKLESNEIDAQEGDIPKWNNSSGSLVGPFESLEDEILEWSPEKRSGTCDRKGQFARLVWSRKFVLIFHELSMTGAPLSMMELASELLSCGATVTAVILNKRGGLMPELVRRKINMLDDKGDLSFKIAMKSDLIIAGSAVCASWIDQYFTRATGGSSQVAWWIMENRREYFDRAKIVLNRVKMLIFLSEAQSRQWLSWCKEENITLFFKPGLVSLSVNDELAFVAGISSSLNTPSFSTEKMLHKRKLLRDAVRKEMGLTDENVLVMTLSSINPGKGQLLLLESARLLIEKVPSDDYLEVKDVIESVHDQPSTNKGKHSRALHQYSGRISGSSNSVNGKVKAGASYFSSQMRRNILQANELRNQSFRLLIGSVGSKSNKMTYVNGILKFLSLHLNLSKSVLWTPAATRVASLYAAADVYVINSQGLGETFGRVTIEAMAFGLPVLGTDTGGTAEIVEHNVTGLLHPSGRAGTQVLAQNLDFLLKNSSAREQMGINGRARVKKMYLKKHMYRSLAEALYKCMKFK
uniref:Glycosyl transferase family 1 domain-containing protein n=1 Tax=Kalanchoe fedtschenkoi TaxID=63787 RepID=A0A7N0ZR42_KALFE